MKVRGRTLGVWVSALCWGTLALLAPIALTACTSSSTSKPSPSVFSPSVSISASGTISASASSGASGTTPSAGTSTTTVGTPGVTADPTATVTPRATRTVTPTATVAPTATVTPTPAVTVTSQVPVAAPVTGGGGTAGFQDALLLVAGLGAIVAGAGSIFYRRRLNRRR